ncbi:Rhodanese-related sulfurtransferases [hydrothermal vent metagenome]|uniref:Rhodanese-related sulfurtransferases n=1 Tax=hydrothermal vent metagenome TaxID=652676 RepID=A0A3B1DWA1_9ZZZZ
MSTAITYKTISTEQLNQLCLSGEAIDLIDVRTPVEFREVHVPIAQNVPLDSLAPEDVMASRNNESDKPLYVICRSGSRSTKASEAFVKAGFTNIVNVEGGTLAWDAAQFPVVRGKKAISLERQVRIVAGLLILLGVGLSFVNPWFVGLSAFVGAGLTFAGITDTCAMGMMLAKMPWNKVNDCGESCSR